MAANETGTYDPQQVQTSLGSLLLDEAAFAPGTFIKCSWDDPKRWKVKKGAGGGTGRARNRNRSMLVEFTLLATAAANDDLQAVADSDENTPNGGGILPFQVVDLGGTTKVQAPDAWIEELPEITFSDEVEVRVWKIRLGQVSKFVAGSATLPTA